jgi:hypothetical protein
MRGIFYLAEELLVFQEGLSSVHLASYEVLGRPFEHGSGYPKNSVVFNFLEVCARLLSRSMCNRFLPNALQ